MARALEEYQVQGIHTTIPFYHRVMNHPEFIKGLYTTSFIEKYFSHSNNSVPHESDQIALIAAAIFEFEHSNRGIEQKGKESAVSENLWRIVARKEGLRS
jgi:acetyl/propionyl-CoA carboxylase alpha subunit